MKPRHIRPKPEVQADPEPDRQVAGSYQKQQKPKRHDSISPFDGMQASRLQL
jgi:hypothetical protein